jgi:hypothetical protein
LTAESDPADYCLQLPDPADGGPYTNSLRKDYWLNYIEGNLANTSPKIEKYQLDRRLKQSQLAAKFSDSP